MPPEIKGTGSSLLVSLPSPSGLSSPARGPGSSQPRRAGDGGGVLHLPDLLHSVVNSTPKNLPGRTHARFFSKSVMAAKDPNQQINFNKTVSC